MKARVIATNKIIDVKKASDDYYIDKENNPYKLDELDLNVGQEINIEVDSSSDFFSDFIKEMFSANKYNEEEDKKEQKRKETYYYRHLRGHIMIILLEKWNYSESSTLDELLKIVDYANIMTDKLIATEKK